MLDLSFSEKLAVSKGQHLLDSSAEPTPRLHLIGATESKSNESVVAVPPFEIAEAHVSHSLASSGNIIAGVPEAKKEGGMASIRVEEKVPLRTSALDALAAPKDRSLLDEAHAAPALSETEVLQECINNMHETNRFRLDSMDAKIETMHGANQARLESMDMKLDAFIASMSQRFEQIGEQLSRIEHDRKEGNEETK